MLAITSDRSTGSTSANEAIQITISQPSKGGPEQIYSFNPEYTEQFFGQDQSIFGYKDLDVKLRFTAHDVYPNLDITYSDKWKAVGDTRAVDLKKIFKEYLPPCAIMRLLHIYKANIMPKTPSIVRKTSIADSAMPRRQAHSNRLENA